MFVWLRSINDGLTITPARRGSPAPIGLFSPVAVLGSKRIMACRSRYAVLASSLRGRRSERWRRYSLITDSLGINDSMQFESSGYSICPGPLDRMTGLWGRAKFTNSKFRDWDFAVRIRREREAVRRLPAVHNTTQTQTQTGTLMRALKRVRSCVSNSVNFVFFLSLY